MGPDEPKDNVTSIKKQAKNKEEPFTADNNIEKRLEKVEKQLKRQAKPVSQGVIENWLVEYFTETGDRRVQRYMREEIAHGQTLDLDKDFPVYFYNYDSKSGTRILRHDKEKDIYEEISKETLEGMIGEDLKKFAVEKSKFKIYALSQSNIGKLAKALMARGKRIESWPLPSGFKTDKGLYFFRHDFDPIPNSEADKFPFIKSVLDRMSDPDAFCMRVGSLFDYKCDRKQALFLYGPTDGGKSSIFDLLRFVVGKEGTHDFSESDLTSSFGKESLVDKRLLLGDEIETTLWASNAFKKFTGTKIHKINPKGEKTYNCELHGLIFASANNPPDIMNEKSFKNRIIMIKVDEVPEDEMLSEDDVLQKYKDELPYFIGHCLDLYNALKMTGKTRIPCKTDLLDSFVADNESTCQFLFDQVFIQDDTIFEPKDAQVTSNQFTQCWEKLCKDYPETAGTGKGKVGCRKFEKFIKSITGRESESFSVPYTNEHGYKARLILGIRLKRP